MDSAVTQRRTQVERRHESEEALLDAAADLVAERGVERASLASIGTRAGASRGLPNHHFGSKDALVARLARRAQNKIDDAMVAAATRGGRRVEDIPGLERLQTAVDTYLTRFEDPTNDDRALIVMWGATFPTEASVEGMLDADRRSRDGWTGLIEQGQQDGSIRADVDPPTGAILLQSLLRGLAASLLVDGHLTDKRQVREASQEWILAFLASRGEGTTTPLDSHLCCSEPSRSTTDLQVPRH
ncbi:TetR/AcrR family transcriptional regulator [Frankia sp. CNm7]|uniref:TetR/AcrR family transcriptional regulator n=1 Tax=Frankia nepalensis TaxID=1836974 RepID=A0A937UVX8_9ACTN|nr:TetR/AcrR family transcriptional regulator [Frankia nepalensis]MBL7499557.1 TetR/AcrR family transcriptional regulator [Frankia nepalensis]MBL7513185.1 TetR/AcrR family transcriptional regulator [Frankia nepalensis]MBL7517588.1 TetR/AcrR family transcriptional regulator [Frankia nepalensis]MBL7633675.1 TetR/AcrR family transcriptional regulator [Frankia nepalensis]